jgi:two-component system chemotaxis response regulator CheB
LAVTPSDKIKVLIVDDSLVVRRMLSRILSADPAIDVVGTAEDPYDAEGKILELHPDVLTLDIEMPKMDGLTFLKILMDKRPMPVIVMSSLSQAGSSYAIDALQFGAVEVLAKPYGPYSVGGVGAQLVDKVKAAAASRKGIGMLRRPAGQPAPAPRPAKPLPVAGEPPPPPKVTTRFHPRQLIALGASTGGTEALKEVLVALPADMPPIVVVQHIPPYFSKAFADRLNGICQLDVKEAEEGDLARPGTVLVAPGDFHMIVQWGRKGIRSRSARGRRSGTSARRWTFSSRPPRKWRASSASRRCSLVWGATGPRACWRSRTRAPSPSHRTKPRASFTGCPRPPSNWAQRARSPLWTRSRACCERPP